MRAWHDILKSSLFIAFSFCRNSLALYNCTYQIWGVYFSVEFQSWKLQSDSHDIWIFCGAAPFFAQRHWCHWEWNKFWIVIEHSITKKKINLRHLLSNKKVAKVVRDSKLNLNIVTIGLQFSRLKFGRKIDTSYLICKAIQK